MKKRQHNDKMVPYPKIRRVLGVMYRSLPHKPMIHALIEVDVTKARQYLREHKANTGESLSFTAFITACVAHAIDENRYLHACRKGRKHLILFDEVDVATQIEREMAGQKQNITYIIRAANRKTFREIHHEIRAAQVEEVEEVWKSFKAMKWVEFLPTLLFRFFWWAFCWMRGTYPQVQKKYGGTVGISSVGMFAKGAGWAIPINDHTLDVTLGGIAEKPSVVDGNIAMREYLCMTLSIDHTIIDGAPAARFAQQLKELIERGYGLIDQDAAS